MKNRALYFTKTGAVITKDMDFASTIKNVILNPDLSYVNSTNPMYWKLYEGHIIPMDKAERLHRDNIIKLSGISHEPILADTVIDKEEKIVNNSDKIELLLGDITKDIISHNKEIIGILKGMAILNVVVLTIVVLLSVI